MNKKSQFFGVLSIGISLFGTAQQEAFPAKVEQLSEVVVSDSRFELKREHSGKTIIKISKKEIENNQGRTIADIINTKSGIEINGTRSVEGNNLGYFIRGGNNRQVLILIDGIQVNDPSTTSNDFDLRLLDLNIISSIEIIKGAASTLYGNAAATAVISITTNKASNKPIAARFLSVVGTNQTQNDLNYNGSSFTNHVSVNGGLKKLSYLASFGSRFADGLSAFKADNAEKDPFSRMNTYVKLGYKLTDAFEISSFISFDKFDTDIDGSPPPTFVFSDTDSRFVSEQTRFGVAPKYHYKNGSIHLQAAFSKIKRNAISNTESTFEGESIVLDAFNKHVFDETLYSIVGFNYSNFQSVFASVVDYTQNDPYLNVVYVSNFGLHINAGTRLNNHSEYGSHLVYNFNPSYSLPLDSGYAKVFASYATSFIAPNLSQLFGFFGPNPDLEPEENVTIEGGLEYSIDKFRANAVYFQRNEENTIIFTTGYTNAITDAKIHGVELEVQADLTKKMVFTSNYTFTEFIDDARLRIPKHKVNAGLQYDLNSKSFASINYQFVGKRTDTDFSTFEDQTLDSFSLVDVYFSYKLIKNKVKLFADLSNVFNENYFEILAFTTRGRNISLGLQLNF